MKQYPFLGPLNKEKNVKVDRKEIARIFNQPILLGTSGSVKLRKGSQTGEILEEFDINSGKVTTSGNELVLFPEKLLPYETEIFLTMNDGFVISASSGEKCNFLNETSNITFSFATEDPIGKKLDGGIVIAKNGGRYIIVSPKESEMILSWHELYKSISHTEKITGTKGWFVPSSHFLINTDLNNKKFWFNAESDNKFWTSNGYEIDMENFSLKLINTNNIRKIRTFKLMEI